MSLSRRLASLVAVAFVAASVLSVAGPGQARAAFGFSSLDLTFTNSDSSPATQAGSHPSQMGVSFRLNYSGADTDAQPDGEIKDVFVEQAPGFVGNATVAPRCSSAQFLVQPPTCAPSTQVGMATAYVNVPGGFEPPVAVYNLEPPLGSAARLGFKVTGAVTVVIDVGVKPTPPYNLIAGSLNTSQLLKVFGVDLTIWGVPADPAHDPQRGSCLVSAADDTCPANIPARPFLTLPRSCGGPLEHVFNADSWENPGLFVTQTAGSPAMTDCAGLAFDPDVTAAPTTNLAGSPSGFDFSIEIDDPGLTDPDGRADSDLKQAVVTLPEGMTVNPAAAGGLAACSAAQLSMETPDSEFGAGCPAASRVASVDVDTPLLEEHLSGSIFLAEPYANPLGELLAGYLVIKQPERGIIVKLTGAIETDPSTGQITASFDQNPQLPFSNLEVSIFGGAKGPLTTPQTCGEYEVRTELHPWSGGPPVLRSSPFTIASAPGGGPCASSPATLPHSPGFDAGSVEPIAGAHSPFLVTLRREDGSQRFKDVTLSPPPGLTAKLAGTAICSDGALAAAASRPGKDEQGSPSCPASSRIGSVFAAVGSGPAPYWAPGTAYLAGPYKGAPLSLAIVTPAVAGPFDLGTVVIRTALHVNSRTAEITAVSDPLPELLQGIPLDIRTASVRLDKPDFALNGTSCDPTAVTGLLTSTLNQVAQLSSRFQLAECTRLGFKPRMTLNLRGGTKRGKHPALTIALMPRAGDANIASVSVALPRSEFLENAHIRTVCTRPDFAADACPAGAVYGEATVDTPLLDYDLAGHVYLRSSDNLLPDLVPDLRGPAYQPIRLESAGRTDSIGGGIRTTIDFVPDAPFSRAVVRLQGGNKGLLVNSRDICKRAYRATVRYTAHNGATHVAKPKLVATGCKKRAKKGKRGAARSALALRSAVR